MVKYEQKYHSTTKFFRFFSISGKFVVIKFESFSLFKKAENDSSFLWFLLSLLEIMFFVIIILKTTTHLNENFEILHIIK